MFQLMAPLFLPEKNLLQFKYIFKKTTFSSRTASNGPVNNYSKISWNVEMLPPVCCNPGEYLSSDATFKWKEFCTHCRSHSEILQCRLELTVFVFHQQPCLIQSKDFDSSSVLQMHMIYGSNMSALSSFLELHLGIITLCSSRIVTMYIRTNCP